MQLHTPVRPEPPRLRREVGPLGLLCVSLGTIIGSAWLFAGAVASSVAGPAALVSWVLAGLIVLVFALLLAELSTAYPVSGGLARYPHLAFGPISGFVAGWVLWLALTVGAALQATAALLYLGNEVPGLNRVVDGVPVLTGTGVVVAVLLLAVFMAINALGVHLLANTNVGLVVVKLAVPVLVAVAIMGSSFNMENFTAHGGFAPFGMQGIVAALPAGVVFAFLGFEQAVQIGGEVRNPSRDLPRALIGTIGLAVLMYLLLQVAFIGALDPASLASGWANPLGPDAYGPYAALASGLGLLWLLVVIYPMAIVSPAGCGLIATTTSARTAYALSRNGYLPTSFGRLSARGVPLFSLVVSFGIGILVLLPSPGWRQIVGLISAGAALIFAFVPLCFAALRRSDPQRRRPYRLGAGELYAPAGFVIASLLFYWAGWKAGSTVLLALVLGLPLLAISCFTGDPRRRPVLDRAAWRASGWLLPYYGGLALLSYLGQFGGGRGVIPFWWDIVLVGAFSLVIFYLAVGLALPAPRAADEQEVPV